MAARDLDRAGRQHAARRTTPSRASRRSSRARAGARRGRAADRRRRRRARPCRSRSGRRRVPPRARPRSCRSRRGRASSPRTRSRRPGSRRRARSCPSSSASWIRRARTSTIFAFPCTVSVTIPGLRAGERDRLVAEIDDRHRRERARDPLADRDEHVELARVGRGRDLVGEREQVVGRLAHRREDGDDAIAGLARGDEPARRRSSASRGRRPRCRRTSSPRAVERCPAWAAASGVDRGNGLVLGRAGGRRHRASVVEAVDRGPSIMDHKKC